MQAFLTSSCYVVIPQIVTQLKKPAKGQKLVFITTAAEPEPGDKSWLNEDRQALIDQGFLVSDYTLTGKNSDQLVADLSPMDVIFVSGGNTFYLLEKAQQSGFTEVVHQLLKKPGKTYIGSSAGSVIAGPSIEAVRKLDDPQAAPQLQGYQGFGFVNFVVMPHWGSQNFKKAYLSQGLKVAYNTKQYPLLVLTDNQYVWVDDSKLQIVNVDSSDND